jgi:hypothetical protein
VTLDSSLGVDRSSISTKASEIEVVFLDNSKDHEKNSAWSGPLAPAGERRVKRVEMFGVCRRTEAQRIADDIRLKAENEGRDGVFRATPRVLELEPCDVFRYTSARLAIDAYFRVQEMSFGTGWFVAVSSREYVPAAWRQQRPSRATYADSLSRAFDDLRPPTARASGVIIDSGSAIYVPA